jgi:hypothetical protein
MVERRLDFARAIDVFAGKHLTRADARMDYAEARFVTAGWLDVRLDIVVWTPRGEVRRGRPKADTIKAPVKIRLDADVLLALRATGDGWQTRINETLQASLRLAGWL